MYSREKLEKLMRAAKVTQQSIQKVSHWMLDNREHLTEMVTLWVELLREGDANHQIVYLYIANDAMQVGVRKFGRQIAQAFEERLLEAVDFVMAHGEEKVKRCAMKIVGIWRERTVLTPNLLNMLQNVCAGKPAVEQPPEAGIDSAEDVLAKRKAFVREMASDSAVEKVLEDLPEVSESSHTTQLAGKLQDLVNATISADMLSDRMFQLESNLSAFHHARDAHKGCDSDRQDHPDDQREELSLPKEGEIAWDLMDQQVYDLDFEASSEHVKQYRESLGEQSEKRDAILQQLRVLETADLFVNTAASATTPQEAEEQALALERLYDVACDAEALELQQLEDQRAEFRAQRDSYASSTTGSAYSAYQSELYRPSSRGQSDSGSNYSSYNSRPSNSGYDHQRSPPSLRRHNSASAAGEGGFPGDRYARDDLYRHRAPDRYDGEDSPYKRAKLQHSQSMESQNVNWQQASHYSPRNDGGYRESYAAVEHERPAYSPRGAPQYAPMERPYQPQTRPPVQPKRRSRWDSMPEDRYADRYEDRGGYNDRRW